MTTDSHGFLISGKTVRGLAENERQRRGYLSPLPKMTRRRYEGSPLSPYIVTEKQTDSTLGGVGENVAVDRNYRPTGAIPGLDSEGFFRARPYVIGTGTYQNDLRSLGEDPDEEVWVATRMIPTVLFTGQLFLVSSAGTHPQDVEDKPVVGDVVTGCIGNTWSGIVRQASDHTNKTLVDIEFIYKLRNNTAANQSYCRIWAANLTNATLVVGQLVRLSYFAAPIVSVSGGYLSRWQITDYECQP